MSESGYHDALRVLCDDAGVDLHRVLTAACEPLSAWDPVVYLADFTFQVLVPLAADVAGQDVAGTMAGRAFTTGQPVATPRDGSVRVWVPVVEQTARTGVLAVTVPDAGAQVRCLVRHRHHRPAGHRVRAAGVVVCRPPAAAAVARP